MIQYFVVVLILMTITKGLSAQQCFLKDSNMNKNWVFTYNKDTLHTDVIADQTSLRLICKNIKYSQNLKCKKGTLDDVRLKGGVCPNRVRATVTNMKTPCSANDMKGKIYEVRYVRPGIKYSPLYDVCYSATNEAVLYARHRAYGFNLPTSNYKRPQFSQDKVVSPERAASFESSTVCNTFNTLLGTGQTYVTSALDFAVQRGHLANAQDFLTYDQMDETFKFINVMPQFRGVNNGNWKAIETWVHKLPKKKTFATVTTGMYGTLELPHSQKSRQKVAMYLMPTQKKNPIPMWTYKLVRYSKRCYGFVSYNNDKNTNSKITTNICKKTACPAGLTFNDEPEKGVSYCCECAHLEKSVGLK